MTSRLSAAQNKCKISDWDTLNLLITVAENVQVNFLGFTINGSTFKGVREYFRKQSTEATKSTFSNLNLNYVVFLRDFYLLFDIINKEKIDRLPVIASSLNVEKLLEDSFLSSDTEKEI